MTPAERGLQASGGTTPGVNLVGFLEGGLGLGEVARKLARAFEHAGIPFAAIPYGRTPTGQREAFSREVSAEAPFDTNVICLNADYLHPFLADVGVDFFAGRYSIGVWFWESSVLRAEDRRSFRFLDEIWVASEYVHEAVAADADVPVHVVPLPIEAPPPPAQTREQLGLPDGFTFLFAFDFVSAQRKNPAAVVEAFERAFEPGEGPTLVLKSINGRERKPQLLAALEASAAGRRDIQIRDGYVSAEEKNAMIALCDCFVSLHRSEGFGLPLAEALAHARPVIATGYSGNVDFMDDDSSYLVPYRLVPVPEEWWAWTPGAEWAEPDVDAAASFMREVYDDPEAAAARGERGRQRILERFSLDRTAAFLHERLDAARGFEPPGARPAILLASQEVDKEIAATLTGAAGRGPHALVRRALARSLWPYLAERKHLDALTLDALASLQRSVDDLGRRVADLERSLAERDS